MVASHSSFCTAQFKGDIMTTTAIKIDTISEVHTLKHAAAQPLSGIKLVGESNIVKGLGRGGHERSKDTHQDTTTH
jgi:hypothetical protein